MFRGLHVRLTLLYLLAALALIALVAVGAYTLLDRYLQANTDLALQYKLAQEFRAIGATLPPDLAEADRLWPANRNQTLPQPTPRPSHSSDDGEEHGESSAPSVAANEDAYDGELAAIFVQPFSANGQSTSNVAAVQPLVTDQAAVTAALAQGRDWGTGRLDDGTRVRLLTYRVDGGSGPAVLQVGRTLSDQDRVLNQLLIALLVLGGISAVLLGLGSWWLAGRSLAPAQQAWERQQAFVANASHELRTPLTLMRASAEVALRGLPDSKTDQRGLLGDVLQECDHMSRLVEDLLLLSRLDGGRLTLEYTTIALPDLLADVQRQVGRLADERGVQLTAQSISGSVRGDPARLRQVLLALLDNALRHTPAGGSIEIGARSAGRQGKIIVLDTLQGL